MKSIKFVLSAIILAATIASCGRFGNKDESGNQSQRIVCVSKQYNEIIFCLGAQKNLVGVDVSSVYPPEIQSLPTVGYHRALSAEGILSMKPTLFMHDGNVGPEQVLQQLQQMNIPIKKFPANGSDLDSTKILIHQVADFFGKQHQADSLCAHLDSMMNIALAAEKKNSDTPKVMIIQFGRAMNAYLVVSGSGVVGKMVEWAGGTIPFKPTQGMVPLSAEIIAQANPDVILMTDYGYDRLGSVDKAKELPGVAATRAAQNNRIFRIEEHDIIYLGPHTGENVLNLEKLIHADKPGS